MENDTESIWLQLDRKGKKKIMIGSIYREHTLLGQGQGDNSNDKGPQTIRWRRFLKQWKTAGRLGDTFVIGDFNLDYSRWNNPSYINSTMVEETKLELETEGFSQLVQGNTRSWRGQQDSLLDHIWSNRPELVLSTTNKIRGASDHNEIGLSIRLKGKEGNRLESFSRKRQNFNLDRYRQKLKNCQWEKLYEMTDTNEANRWLEEKLRVILQEECPQTIIQSNKKMKSWVTKSTVDIFIERDRAREDAKVSNTDEDWRLYKNLRNKGTKALRKDKKSYFENLYNRMEKQNDVKNMYKTTRKQLGWQVTGPPQSLVVQGRKVTAPK